MTTLHVGDRLPPLAVGRVSRTTLALFAGASGDHNPLHIDLDAARSAGLDDVIGHGMLSMAFLGRLLTDWVPQEHIRSFQVRFTATTPVDAAPTCTGVVTEIVGSLATIEAQVALADGTVTLAGSATVDVTGSRGTTSPRIGDVP